MFGPGQPLPASSSSLLCLSRPNKNVKFCPQLSCVRAPGLAGDRCGMSLSPELSNGSADRTAVLRVRSGCHLCVLSLEAQHPRGTVLEDVYVGGTLQREIE